MQRTPRKGERRRSSKSTVDAIEELRLRREERRRSAEQFKRAREEEQRRNEAAGRPGDVDFQRMIDAFRRNCKITKRTHRVVENTNINICVRKRPIVPREVRHRDFDSVTCINPITMVHAPQKKVDGITKYLDTTEFSFDHSFDEADDNETVYRVTAEPLVPFVINGGNATVFAYGQTGSGKTYTMTAMEELLSESLFACLRERNEDSLSVHVSFFEIYGGRCIDLLNSRKRLAVREDGRGQVQIAGLVRKEVRSEAELREYIKRGNATRSTSKTEMNEASSRSHAICQLTIMDSATRGVRGKYSLIDLAGSERAADTKNHNRQRRVEGAEINKSLLALKECIRALDSRNKGRGHIPYRASKLTLVLKDSFSSTSRTVMICNISPAASAAEHTLNTLRYADRVKQKEVVHYLNASIPPNSSAPSPRLPAPSPRRSEPKAPLSPMGDRLRKAQVDAKEGRITQEEKARIKEKIIEQGDHGYEGKYAEKRQPQQERPRQVQQQQRRRQQQQQQEQQQRQKGARRQWGKPTVPAAIDQQRSSSNDNNNNNNNNNNRRDKKDGQARRAAKLTPRGGGKTPASRLPKPDAARKVKGASPAEKDLKWMHQSLRANRASQDEGDEDASKELLSLHETVSQLVEEEEKLLQFHMDSIQENAQLLTEEGLLLQKVQGEDVVDYDIDMYAERLDDILSRKIKMYTDLHSNLKQFREHLAQEEAISQSIRHVQQY